MSNFNKVGFIFSQFLGNCIQGHRIICIECSKLKVLVLSNSLCNWGNKSEVSELMLDTNYNKKSVIVSLYNSAWEEWWRQEYIKEYMVKTVEEIPKEECSICLDKLINPVETMCGHIFCKECIEKCNADRYSHLFFKCPLCRTTNKNNNPFYKILTYEYKNKENCCYNIQRYKNNIYSCGNKFICNYHTKCYKCEYERYKEKDAHNILQFQMTFGAYPTSSKNEDWVIVDCMGNYHNSFDEFMENGATYDDMSDTDTTLSYPNEDEDGVWDGSITEINIDDLPIV